MNKTPLTLTALRRADATTPVPESEGAFAREVLDALAALDELPKGPSHQEAGTVERTRHRMYTWLWTLNYEGFRPLEYAALANIIHDRGYFPHANLLLALSWGWCSEPALRSARFRILAANVLDDLAGPDRWIPLFAQRSFAPLKTSPRGFAWKDALRKLADIDHEDSQPAIQACPMDRLKNTIRIRFLEDGRPIGMLRWNKVRMGMQCMNAGKDRNNAVFVNFSDAIAPPGKDGWPAYVESTGTVRMWEVLQEKYAEYTREVIAARSV